MTIENFGQWIENEDSNHSTASIHQSTTVPSAKLTDSFVDPFRLWSRRDKVTLEEIQGVWKRFHDDRTVCRDKTFHFPETVASISSMEQLSAAMTRSLQEPKQQRNQTSLIIGVLGDSVSADTGGWVEALESLLKTSPLFERFDDILVRNYAKGATGARFTYFCNDLRGDEDIVMFQNVRPGESEELYGLVDSLQKSGFAILLLSWHGIAQKMIPRDEFGFEKAANDFNVPLVILNENADSLRACLPPTTNASVPMEKLIYRDEIHPSRLGEVTIATAIGSVLGNAVSRMDPKYGNGSRMIFALPERSLSAFDTVCFSRLECSKEDINKPEGTRHCLIPQSSDGFQIGHSIQNGKIAKTWWEGFCPGNFIEFQLDESCSDIVLFYNRRVDTNGMVLINIDGKLLDSNHQNLDNDVNNLPQGILDGWYKGFWWLPKHRGFLKDQIIAHDLEPSPHSVRMEIQSQTHAENRTFKFDFVALACRKGHE